MPQIVEKHIATGELAYIFRNYPLPSHAQAVISAEAAECAGLQGKFWEMHDQVFLNQGEWSGNPDALQVFVGYAAALGLDQAAFQACMGEHQTQQKIQDDQIFGQQIGVPATPAFLVRAKGFDQAYPIVGAVPYEDFLKGIQTVSGSSP